MRQLTKGGQGRASLGWAPAADHPTGGKKKERGSHHHVLSVGHSLPSPEGGRGGTHDGRSVRRSPANCLLTNSSGFALPLSPFDFPSWILDAFAEGLSLPFSFTWEIATLFWTTLAAILLSAPGEKVFQQRKVSGLLCATIFFYSCLGLRRARYKERILGSLTFSARGPVFPAVSQ